MQLLLIQGFIKLQGLSSCSLSQHLLPKALEDRGHFYTDEEFETQFNSLNEVVITNERVCLPSG